MQQKRAYNPYQTSRLIILTGELGEKRQPRIRVLLTLLSILLLTMSTVAADFVVIDGRSVIERNRLRTDAELDLKLEKAPVDALRAGIPLTLSIEIQLLNHQSPMWKQKVANWQYRYVLEYHRLFGRYVVENMTSGHMKTFATLVEALNSLSRVSSSEKLPKRMDVYNKLVVRLRIKLETNELPAPLRLITIFFPDWQQTSGWQQWNLAH